MVYAKKYCKAHKKVNVKKHPPIENFIRIKGFKKMINCRGCGKKVIVSNLNMLYCKKCHETRT